MARWLGDELTAVERSYYDVRGQGPLVLASGTGWFDWLKRLLGIGKQTVPGAETPEHKPNPTPSDPSGGVQDSAGTAVGEFGESFIGVVEIGSQGSRVTAGTCAKNVSHLTLSKQN
jgi:hypothetical protein